MKAGQCALSPADIRSKAREWYCRQLDVIALAHGTSWPTHRDWVESYLKEELRQRLEALGWRPRA